MMALLYETVPAFENIWFERLGKSRKSQISPLVYLHLSVETTLAAVAQRDRCLLPVNFNNISSISDVY